MSKVYIISQTNSNPPSNPAILVAVDFIERGHTLVKNLYEADWIVMFIKNDNDKQLNANIIHHALKHNIKLDIVGYKPSIHVLNGKKNVTFFVNYNNFVARNFLI